MGSDRLQPFFHVCCDPFQSTLPVWGATSAVLRHETHSIFQSTLPVWGATGKKGGAFLGWCQISIHAPRVGSDCRGSVLAAVFCISIHAPRVGSDPMPSTRKRRCSPISIHAPRVGSDCNSAPYYALPSRFQSTLPVWGATPLSLPVRHRKRRFQSTLPVWGATPQATISVTTVTFQSTLPVWGATGAMHATPMFTVISIHAPRVGSDKPGRMIAL